MEAITFDEFIEGRKMKAAALRIMIDRGRGRDNQLYKLICIVRKRHEENLIEEATKWHQEARQHMAAKRARQL